jgi:site-specific recombinase XerD
MHALGCLDTRVLTHAMAGRIKAVRPDKKLNVPVVMTRHDVATVLARLDGTAHLVATRLYGSGWRLMEAVRLRGTDVDDPMTPRTVQSGQGDQHRCTTVPAILTPWRQYHLAGVTTRPQPDLAQGPGAGAWRGAPAPGVGSEVAA